MEKLDLLDPKTVRLVSKLESEILDLIDHRDDYTRSDLQGVVSAQVIKILNVGLELARER